MSIMKYIITSLNIKYDMNLKLCLAVRLQITINNNTIHYDLKKNYKYT